MTTSKPPVRQQKAMQDMGKMMNRKVTKPPQPAPKGKR